MGAKTGTEGRMNENSLPTVFFPYCRGTKMLKPDFIETCLEAKFFPLVDDDRADEEIFRHLSQLKITGDIVAVAACETYTLRVLFLVEKASVAEAGFLCVCKI